METMTNGLDYIINLYLTITLYSYIDNLNAINTTKTAYSFGGFKTQEISILIDNNKDV